MNRIVLENEQLFVNKRSILAPQTHDLSKYEIGPKRDKLESGEIDSIDEDYVETTPRRRNEYDDVGDGDRRHHESRRIPSRYKNLDDERNTPSFEELTKDKRNLVTDYS